MVSLCVSSAGMERGSVGGGGGTSKKRVRDVITVGNFGHKPGMLIFWDFSFLDVVPIIKYFIFFIYVYNRAKKQNYVSNKIMGSHHFTLRIHKQHKL